MEIAAADAHDAMFAGVVVWKPLQLMLMMLLAAGLVRGNHRSRCLKCGVCRDSCVEAVATDAHDVLFARILVWKLLQLMLMMRCLQGLQCGNRRS